MSTFDANGNRTSLGYPGGNTIENSYDSLNRLTNIVSGSGTTFANYTYAGIHQTNVLYGNGKNIASTFDGIGRMTTLGNGIKNYSFTYDNVGNITSDGFKNYAYDNLYRLTQASETNSGNTLENFQYDPMGNRTTSSQSSLLGGEGVNGSDYDTNILNQYTNLSGSTLSGALSYDNNGNLSENTKFRFVYDYKNRLVKVIEKAHSGTTTSSSSTGSGIQSNVTTSGSGTDTGSGIINSGSGTDTGSGILTDSGSTTGTGTFSDSGSLTGSGIDTSSGTTVGTGIIDTGSGVITDSGSTATSSGALTDSGTLQTNSGATTTTSSGIIDTGSGTVTGTGTDTGSGTIITVLNISVASEVTSSGSSDIMA